MIPNKYSLIVLGISLSIIIIQTILGMTHVWPSERKNRDEGYCKLSENHTKCIVDSFFCEKLYSFEESPFFCQKANGLSSLSFFLPVIYISFVLKFNFHTEFFLNIFFIIINIWNTFGNLAYHGFCSEQGQALDGSGFMWILAWISTMSLYRLFEQRLSFLGQFNILLFFIFTLGFASIGESWAFDSFGATDTGTIITIISFGIIIGIPVIIKAKTMNYDSKLDFIKKNQNILISIFFAANAILVWFLQKHHNICWETSWFQLHAIWHFFMGMSILFIYIHFNREYGLLFEYDKLSDISMDY